MKIYFPFFILIKVYLSDNCINHFKSGLKYRKNTFRPENIVDLNFRSTNAVYQFSKLQTEIYMLECLLPFTFNVIFCAIFTSMVLFRLSSDRFVFDRFHAANFNVNKHCSIVHSFGIRYPLFKSLSNYLIWHIPANSVVLAPKFRTCQNLHSQN